MNKWKIAMADDDADDREFFKESLEDIDEVELVQYVNGEELIKGLAVMKDLPQLVFLDLNMPVKNGHETLDELKSDKRLQDLPVFIYTTTRNQKEIEKTFNAGASLYIPKPDKFSNIKKIFEIVLTLNPDLYIPQAIRNKFVLEV